MSQKQLQRYQVVSMAVEGRCTVGEAALALGVSPRQMKRLKRAVRDQGPRGVVHGNSRRGSPRRTAEQVRQRVLRLARGKYKGFNDTHLCECIREFEGLVLGRETLRRILRSEGLASPKRHRAARHRSRRPRRPQQGLLVQLDGSYHDWLSGRGPWLCLHSAIDDATNIVVGAHFEYAEDAAGYLRLLRQIITGYGIPLSVYSDRHGIFQVRSLDQANAFLARFLPRFNKRFAQTPAQPQIACRRLPSSVDLDRICSLGYQSLVANDNTVRIGNRIIDIPPGPGGRSYAKTRVDTHQLLDRSWRVYHHERLIAQTAPDPDQPLRTLKHRRSTPHSYSPDLALCSKPLHTGGDRFTGQLG